MSMKMPTYSMELQLLWNSIQRFRIRHKEQLVGGLYYTTLVLDAWFPDYKPNRVCSQRITGKPYRIVADRWASRHKRDIPIDLDILLHVKGCFINNGRVRSALTILTEEENIFQTWCMIRGRKMNEDNWDYFNRATLRRILSVSNEIAYTSEYIQP